jgi:hypothetical protein
MGSRLKWAERFLHHCRSDTGNSRILRRIRRKEERDTKENERCAANAKGIID